MFDAIIHKNKSEVANKLAIVKQFLSEGSDINVTVSGTTLLFHPAQCGYDELTQFLLENGANPNAQANEEEFEDHYAFRTTPLLLACMRSEHDSIKLLLEYKANINTKGPNNFTPFLTACERSDIKAIQLMLELAYPQLLQVQLHATGTHTVRMSCKDARKFHDEVGNQALTLLYKMLIDQKSKGANESACTKLIDVIAHLEKQVQNLDNSVIDLKNSLSNDTQPQEVKPL